MCSTPPVTARASGRSSQGLRIQRKGLARSSCGAATVLYGPLRHGILQPPQRREGVPVHEDALRRGAGAEEPRVAQARHLAAGRLAAADHGGQVADVAAVDALVARV